MSFLCLNSVTALVWMCHRCSKNHKITRLHERCLKIINCDKNFFEELLNKDGSVTIHKLNLQFLAIEKFKVAKNSAPPIVYKIFQKNEQNIYNLRNTTEFNIPLVKTVYNSLDILSYLGPKGWIILPVEYKETESPLKLKTKIKR